MAGFTPPAGVTDRQKVRGIQAHLGVKQDGIWGPQTQAAWEKKYGSLWQSSIAVTPQVANTPDKPPLLTDHAGGVKVHGRVGDTTNGILERKLEEIQSRMRSSQKFSQIPKGIDDEEEIRQVQRRLGVEVTGAWGRETQEAWDKMRSPQILYQAPKGIDNAEEIRQVQQRLGVEVSGEWGKETQEAWSKMRSPQILYQAPKGIDDEEEIRQVQRRLGVDVTGVWGKETQEAWNKMRSPQILYQAPKGINARKKIWQVQQRLGVNATGVWNMETQEAWNSMRPDSPWMATASASEIDGYYDEQLNERYNQNQMLERLIPVYSESLRASLEQQAAENLQEIERLLQEKEVAQNAVMRRMEIEHPFYLSETGADLADVVANKGRALWNSKIDVKVDEIHQILQTSVQLISAVRPSQYSVIDRIPSKILAAAQIEHYQHNREALAKHQARSDNGNKKKAFDNGYIIDQRRMEDVKYALGDTAKNGCGWIAAYNVMKMLGNNPDAADILRDMEPGALLFGSLGTDPFYIADYLSAQGCKVEFHTSMIMAEKAAKEADANIYVYFYVTKDGRLGGHYVAFNYDTNKDRFFFYNGEPMNGPEDSPADGYEYLSSHYLPGDIMRFTISIYNPEGE